MTRLELLAPARNADIGIAAIRCGADAIYIGGPAFGARVQAGNSVDDIISLCNEAAAYAARIYVTVNTLATDEAQRREIVAMMMALKDKGVSAFIIQDTTLLPLLRKRGPWKEEFHASTQCAIRTAQRAEELFNMGFSRLILERELSIEQIKAIHAAVPQAQLEFFVHGAICVCYSGDCYLSEYLTGRSANRGECAQPCRSRYDLVDGNDRILVKDKPILSMKDLKLISRLEDLAECGVVSFKIEGRLKSESYVKNVVRAYDIALNDLVSSHRDRYCRSSLGRVSGGFSPNLEKTFNRGYTDLFIDGRKDDWNSGNAAKAMGEAVGTFARPSVPIHNGDGLCFISRQGQVVGFRADKVENDHIICKQVQGLRPETRIWRNMDMKFEQALQNDLPSRLIDITLDLHFDKDSCKIKSHIASNLFPESELICETSFPLPPDTVEAQNSERMKLLIANQICKVTEPYRFSLGELSFTSIIPLLSSGFINGIRRVTAARLREFLLHYELSEHQAAKSDSMAEGAVKPHPVREGELMRTKYCILNQLGKCLKNGGDSSLKNGLFLSNNGKRIRLHFDCANCEMVLLADNLERN